LTNPASDATQRSIAIAAVVLIGANVQVKYGITIALLPVALLFPVWMPVLSGYPFARTLLAAAGVAVFWGTMLAWFATEDHEVNKHQAVAAGLMIVTAFGAVGVLLWACELLRVETVIILFGVGLAASHLTDHAGWAANPWKYGFALPTAIIAITLAGRARSLAVGILALAAVGLMSVVSDYRSFAAFCMITILVLLWQLASRSASTRAHKAAPLLMLGAIGFGVYNLLSNLLVSGFLGSGLQQRSTAQIEASGSLLIGGRPEWAATTRLMSERPQGFGFGVLPNAIDVNHGDAGLESVNIDPANGYEAYMFGGGFRLHSLLADLWSAAGWGGLLLTATVFVILLVRLATALAERVATPILVFATVFAMWAIAFSPIFTDLKDLTLAAFVALSSRAKRVIPPPLPDPHRPRQFMKLS
jgi:hypothetical protein